MTRTVPHIKRKTRATKGHEQGFTLMELMIVISIVAIIVALAIPSFNRSTRNALMLNHANDWAAALYMARARALETRRDVRVCPTANNASCDGSKSYADGWIMFVDQDNNGLPASAEVIQIGAAMDSRIALTTPAAFSQYIEFKPSGAVRGNAGNAGNFSLCSDDYDDLSRSVRISATGRVAAKHEENLCVVEEEEAS